MKIIIMKENGKITKRKVQVELNMGNLCMRDIFNKTKNVDKEPSKMKNTNTLESFKTIHSMDMVKSS